MSAGPSSSPGTTVGDRVRRWFRRRREAATPELSHGIDQLSYFGGLLHLRGWAYHPLHRVVSVDYRMAGDPPCPITDRQLDSPDAVAVHGEEASHSGFSADIAEPDPGRAAQLQLVVTLANGEQRLLGDLVNPVLRADPYHRLVAHFFDVLSGWRSGTVLEIGARNRSGNVRRELVPPTVGYVGFDVLPGENVDVVGDAHELSRHFAPESFDAVFSMSTFEHLLMPWKVAIEMNRVLKPGGLVFTTTHQTWPLHEEPWDFWRFSSHSWTGIFNPATGFEVVQAVMGEPASVVARTHHPIVAFAANSAMLASASLCRKTGPPTVEWDVDVPAILATHYPTEGTPS